MDCMKKEDRSGPLSTISEANSSTCDSDTAASGPHEPQGSPTLSTLQLPNAIGDTSPVEDERTLPDAFGQLSTASDNGAAGIASNEGGGAVATEQHLAVRLDDRSDVHRPFPLTRSPTIRCFEDNGEGPLQPYRLDPIADEFETDDESLNEEDSRVPLTSPSLLSFGDDACTDASPPDFHLYYKAQGEAAVGEARREESSNLIDTPEDLDRPCGDRGLDVTRDPTGVPETQPAHRPRPSDDGHQRFKHQREEESGANQDKSAIQEWAESFPNIPCDPAYVSQHELNCQLFGALQQTRDPRDKGFLPKGQLGRLINPDSVFRELSKSLSQTLSPGQIKKCANTVCTKTEVVLSDGTKKMKSFRKIFALLVLVEKSSSIWLFIQENVSDLDLPLTTVRNGGLIELRRRVGSGGPSSEVLSCFSQWSPVRRKEFEEYQWTMLAPSFTKGQYNDVAHQSLDDQCILPFVFTQNEEDANAEFLGGFGRVFMVRIHPEHHNFHDPMHCDRGFAIKQLLQNDRPSFKREVDILKKFSGEKSHPHVVSLLATYEQFNKFHLIFYRAEGNLFKYWQDINPSPEFDYGHVLWMAKQCAGIADGLLRLHKHYTMATTSSIPHYDKEEAYKRRSTGDKHVRVVDPLLPKDRENPSWSSGEQQVEFTISAPGTFCLPRRPTGERPARLVNEPYSGDQVRQWGRHGDLKPENILWYRDAEDEHGILRVSDFGEAELNSRWSKSKRRSKVANTMTYRPPECDLQPKIIRQSYDIWCLGCVYMEFVTWMLGGVKLWKEFAKQRLTWDVFQSAKSDTFFEIVKNEDTDDVRVMVKEAVTKFFDKLHSHPNCTEYFHVFLDIIQHNMLVVEPSTVYETRRMYCWEVSRTLNDAYRKCCDDVDYATQKNPWTPKRITAEPLMESVKVSMTDEAKEVINENLGLLRAHYGPPSVPPPTESPTPLVK